MTNKKTFKTTLNGKEVTLAVIKPTPSIEQKANIAYAKSFADFLKAGAILKAKLESTIAEQKIWDEEKQKEFINISTRLQENKKIVEGKVNGTSLTKAKEAAIQMRRDRIELQNLISDKTALEANTVEGQAEQVKFNYLVSACTVYSDTGNPVFKSVDDYLENNEEIANKAASEFAMLYYDYDPESEKKLPENAFLLKYKFCDEKLRLVNKDGHRVDAEGRLVNEEGRYVDKDGNYVDIDGKPIDKDGNYIEPVYEFIDDINTVTQTEPEKEKIE